MAAGPAVPGLICNLAAMVLLVFVSVSVPTWNTIYLFHANNVRYGVFGFTGSQAKIGYNFNGQLPGNHRLEETVILNLTDALILHPIGAGLAGLAVLFGICGAAYHRAGTVFMTLLSALALLVTLVAWVFDMALFGIARQQFRNSGFDADYGNGVWITLGALAVLAIGFCASACGIFGSYRRRRATY
ncbi:pali-domain-containing protein [Vararia minispora EC-137]|uniref:Pali-domain-containing protein n=1 Tax=Vararia minispora EC-137 TaxID=1314806 RepID=A0ACB8QVA8_9AGAM|nr:pali-domain-containing protein [Vararia minispora EC-137]